MKDAKGHGSEKRGGAAHQYSVNRLPQAPFVSKAALDIIRKNPQGFSVTPGGKQPTTGHMVAIPGRELKLDMADLASSRGHAIVAQHIATHADVYSNSNVHLGGWAHAGRLSLEPSENIRGRRAAILAGRERNQIAIWDVKNKREIPTGGTGK